MPTVKTYGQHKAQTQLVQGAKATPLPSAAFNNLSEGVGALAQGIAEMNDRVDTTEAEEAMVHFEREKNNLFFNADDGYFKTQGRTAYDGAQGMSTALTDLQKRYSEGLQSENARKKFDSVSNAHVTRGSVDIQRHATKGFQAWEIATFKASNENTLENAALYFNDPERLNVQLAIGEQNIRDVADMTGLNDANLLNEDLETYRSAFYSSAVQAAIVQSGGEGETALEKYGDRIEGPQLNKLQVALERKQKEERTRNNAIEATTRATKLMNSDMSYGEMIGEVDQIANKEVQKATRSELAYQNSQSKTAESDASAESYSTLYDLMDEGEGLEVLKVTYASDWEQLTPSQKSTLSKVSKTGVGVSTNWVVYSDLMLLKPTKLGEINPNDYKNLLADTEFKSLVNAVKVARKPVSDDIDTNQPGRSQTIQTNHYVTDLFGDKSGWNHRDEENVNVFYSMLDREVRIRKRIKGNELTSEEYTTILNDFTRDYVIKKPGFLGMGGITLKLEADFDDIDLDNIIQYLHDNDIPATEANIRETYKQASQ